MIGALRSQLLIMRRRPLLRLLVASHLALLVGTLVLPAVLLAILPQLQHMSTDTPLIPPAAAEQLRRQALFPGIFAAIFGHINGLGGLLVMIFAGAFVGADYGWGTLRTTLARQPRRGRWLASKLGALLVLAAAMPIVTLLVGLPLGALNGAMLGAPLRLSWADSGPMLLGLARATYGLLPYVLLASTCAIAGRSALAGVAGSLLLWAVEQGLGVLAVLRVAGALGKAVYDLTPAQNVGALTELTRRSFGVVLQSGAGGLDLSFPPPARAALLLALYAALLLAAALWLLRRRDVGGPA